MAHITIDHPNLYVLDGEVHELRVETTAGRINVVGTEGPVTVEVSRITGRPVEVDHRDGVLRVRQRSPRAGLGLQFLLDWLTTGQRHEAAVSLAVPPDCRVYVDSASGPIVLSNLHESVAVQSVAGEVTLAEIHGRTNVSTTSGDIVAESVTGDLSTRTVAGAITIITADGGHAQATTTSGAITLDLATATTGSVDLSSVAGALTIRLPHRPDLTVEMSSTSGRTTSAFPDVEIRRYHGSSRMRGVLGSGAGRLTATTVSGSLTLLRSPVDASGIDDDVEDVHRVDDVPTDGDDVAEGNGPSTGEANTA
jgi:hypothetical protein